MTAEFSCSPGTHPSHAEAARDSPVSITSRYRQTPVPRDTGAPASLTPASPRGGTRRAEGRDRRPGAAKNPPGTLPGPEGSFPAPAPPRPGRRWGARPPGSPAAGTGRPPRPAPGRAAPHRTASPDPRPRCHRCTPGRRLRRQPAGSPPPAPLPPAAQLAGKRSANSCGTRRRRGPGLTDTPAPRRGRTGVGPLRAAPPLPPSSHPQRRLRGGPASPGRAAPRAQPPPPRPDFYHAPHNFSGTAAVPPPAPPNIPLHPPAPPAAGPTWSGCGGGGFPLPPGCAGCSFMAVIAGGSARLGSAPLTAAAAPGTPPSAPAA